MGYFPNDLITLREAMLILGLKHKTQMTRLLEKRVINYWVHPRTKRKYLHKSLVQSYAKYRLKRPELTIPPFSEMDLVQSQGWK